MKPPMKLNRYQIIVAAVWVSVGILLGTGYFLFYEPQQSELQQSTSQCNESQASLAQAQLAIGETTRIKQQQRCEEVDALLSALSIPQDAVTELVFEIGRIATNDLRLFEFSSKNHQQKSHPTVGKSKLVSEVWLKVDFQATFEQFAKFLNQLESHTPVVFVEEVAFRRGTGNSPGHKVSLELSFLTKTETGDMKFAAARNSYRITE
jgi:Tfp pilus assembly protein PilO